MLKQISRLTKELVLGIWGYGIIVLLIILIFINDKLFYCVGLLEGLIIATCMIVHMQISLDKALNIGEAGAEGHIRKSYGIRTAVVFLSLGLIYYFHLGSVLTAFIGIMGLKVAAYIQPFTNKFTTKKYVGKGR